MEFGVLGPLEVRDGPRTVDLGGLKQRAVLAVLLINANRVVSLDRMIDELWGDEPPSRATGSLQAYISNLRRALEPDRPPRAPATVLVSQAPGYALRIRPEQLDAVRFEELAGQGRRLLDEGRPDEARQVFEQARQLWRGPPLAEFAFEPFASAEIARLVELRATVDEGRIDAELALGHHGAAAAALEAVVAEHPLRERPRAQLMLALYRAGRQADALRVYAETRAVLADELGLDPGPALQQLEREILQQSPSLEWRPPDQIPVPAPAAVKAPPEAGSPPADTPGSVADPLEPVGSAAEGLVGRTKVLARLRVVLAAAVGGSGRLLLLSGEPGIGKTRLAEVVAGEAAGRGAAVAWGRSYEGEGAPAFWP